MDDERINIISVYNKDNWSRVEEITERWLEDNRKKDREHIVIGDFNIRTGELGGGEEEEGNIERRSKDRIIATGDRNLIDLIQSKGWYLLNGTTNDDWNGEYTFV